MNENMNTVVVTQEPEEIELDLRDMFATLFLRWKTLLLCFLAGALVFGLYTMPSAPRTMTGSFVTEADVHAARQAVSEGRADAIDRLYQRVQLLTDYLHNIEREYSNLSGTGETMVHPVTLQGTYFVSSEIDNIGSYISSIALGEEEYNRLRKIISADGTKAEVFNIVEIFPYAGSQASNGKTADYEDGQYLFTVKVYGSSEEQCAELLAVAEQAVQQRMGELRNVDSSLEFKPVGNRISYNAREFVESRQAKLWGEYSYIDEQLTEQKTKVNALSSAEKAYYDKLYALDHGGMTVSRGGRSLKKWTSIGAVLGLFAGVVLVFWPYLFDGKVKTAGELEYSLRSMVLNRVCVKGRRNLFGRWAARLIGADDIDPAVKADMIAADLGVLMEKSGKKALYLLCNADDTNAAIVAEQVKARLLEKNPDADITVGNPLSAAEQMEKIGAAEFGVVFAEVKKTKRALLRQWMQVCARYCLPVAGSVAVQKCYKC